MAAALYATQGFAQPAAESGAEAFARNDFAAAARHWRAEAAAGSSEAKFGLGLLNDLGLGMTRDPSQALRWYVEAAREGLPEAEFNVGVMLDAGTGITRDTAAAAVWYARAAANGHKRAAYNLAQLYLRAEGVPRNADFARYWLGRADTLPASRELLGPLRPPLASERRLTAPEPAGAAVVPDGPGSRAELVWSAPPAPAGARYLVEIARLPVGDARSGQAVLTETTDASAVSVRLPRGDGRLIWRVSAIDGAEGHYATKGWQPAGGTLDPGERDAIPRGHVTLKLAAGDGSARTLANELARSFALADLWVSLEEEPRPAGESAVTFAYMEDADLAARVAKALPAVDTITARLAPDPAAAPRSISAWLVGGPREPEE